MSHCPALVDSSLVGQARRLALAPGLKPNLLLDFHGRAEAQPYLGRVLFAEFKARWSAMQGERDGQAVRAERTRSALLESAERVFARDGFEASRIEDIAAEAGRSRGAFYANFASKAEVFLALRTLASQRRAREVRALLEPIKGEEQRYQAVLRYILEQICDTRTLLLQMEFKLFALRHPELLKELAEKHLEAVMSVNQRELADLFAGHKETFEQMRYNSLAIEAVLEGFALNAMFCPEALTQERLQKAVPEMVAMIFQRDQLA